MVLLRVALLLFAQLVAIAQASDCLLQPLGPGYDDTDQVEAAIAECGQYGTTEFQEGLYNITRKMSWNLVESRVVLKGYLSFIPDIEYWLNASNIYRVVFIQSQPSWFVVTGRDFILDGDNRGGVEGNGHPWWDYFVTHSKGEGFERPISLTLHNVTRGAVKNFRIESPPSWCNTVAQSKDVLYDGMYCNATNSNPAYLGKNVVPNTDGINTYRSDNVTLLNWDITDGDDCLAIKGNSTNVYARNVTCRGGNGIAIGSLGQYVDLPDIVENVTLEDIQLVRLDSQIQPNLANGVYIKTWTGTVNGVPPTGGGGAGGRVKNVTARNVKLDRVNAPVHVYQTNGGRSSDVPSQLQISDITFTNWTGMANTNKLVDIQCSPVAPCPGIRFVDFQVSPPNSTASRYICKNVIDLEGLPAACNATGLP